MTADVQRGKIRRSSFKIKVVRNKKYAKTQVFGVFFRNSPERNLLFKHFYYFHYPDLVIIYSPICQRIRINYNNK